MVIDAAHRSWQEGLLNPDYVRYGCGEHVASVCVYVYESFGLDTKVAM